MTGHMRANIRVTAHSQRGERKYMEDCTHIHFEEAPDGRILWSFFGVFDGHGGPWAAEVASGNLMKTIVSDPNFWTDDDELISKAIEDGFLLTHKDMWNLVDEWPETKSGYTSTAGTTASVMFIKNDKAYVGHVGDSAIIMGIQETFNGPIKGVQLTTDHKPDTPAEHTRIQSAGGAVMVKNGVNRVVWRRPKKEFWSSDPNPEVPLDSIPFLAIARSLGDLWSYNGKTDQYVVSPKPDLHVIKLNYKKHKCIILGSDGLWNMVKPQNSVDIVKHVEKQVYDKAVKSEHFTADYFINPSHNLVNTAIDRWQKRNLRADNTTAIVIMIDHPSKPRKEFLLEERETYFATLSEETDTILAQPNGVRNCVRLLTTTKFRKRPRQPVNRFNNNRESPKQIFASTKHEDPPCRHNIQASIGPPKDENTSARAQEVSSLIRKRRSSHDVVEDVDSPSNCLKERNTLTVGVKRSHAGDCDTGHDHPKIPRLDGGFYSDRTKIDVSPGRRKSCPDRLEGSVSGRRRHCSGGYVQVTKDIKIEASDVDKQFYMQNWANVIMEKVRAKREALEAQLVEPVMTRRRSRALSLELNPIKRLRSGREVFYLRSMEKSKILAKMEKNKLNKFISIYNTIHRRAKKA